MDWNSILQPLYAALAATIIGAVATSVPLVLTWLNKRTGIVIEASHRDALQRALENAAGLVIQRAMQGAPVSGMNVGSPQIVDAANYVEDAVPDAVQHFGLTSIELQPKVLAKIGKLTAQAPVN